MVKWWYSIVLTNSQEDQRQQHQFDTEARMGSDQSVNSPSYKSATHHVNAAGGIQIIHMENGTQVVTGTRYAYAESVPESSVTEDFEKDDVATEDSRWQTEDTDDAVSHRKKSTSPTSSKSTVSQSKTPAEIQNNNNTGNGTQSSPFSSQGNMYTFNSGGGRHYQHAEF